MKSKTMCSCGHGLGFHYPNETLCNFGFCQCREFTGEVKK